MKTTFIIFGLSLLLFATTAISQNKNISPYLKNTSSEMLNEIVNANMLNENISGASACIIKGGEVIWSGNFGLSNRETSTYVTDTTQFLLYSITKTFTGIAIMQLYEQGLLNLDDPVNNYLPFEIQHPDYPDTDITFRMLLMHTSGIRDNWDLINALMTYNVDTDISLGNFLENYLTETGTYYGANSSYTNLEPGIYFSYSNVGASLIGYLVETISGQSYEEYLTENILNPLGMSKTKLYLSDIDASNLAVEYGYSNNAYNTVGYISNPILPAGFLHSNLQDMSSYLQMIINRGVLDDVSILSEDTFELLITEHNPNLAPHSGFFFAHDHINNLWGHSGGYNGVKTTMFFDKEEDWGVVVLSNGSGEPWQLAYFLYQYAKDYIALEATQIIVDDHNANSIIENNENIDLNIFVRNNSLNHYDNIDVILACANENVIVTNSADFISSIGSGGIISNPLYFSFNVSENNTSFDSNFTLHFYQNDILIDSTSFKIILGTPEILIINDEEHIYKTRVNALSYYTTALLANNKTFGHYDINLFGIPNSEKLLASEAVVWFTSLDNTNFYSILSQPERNLLEQYLNNNGKLFLSSQNASEALSETSFIGDYLKCEHIGDWVGQNVVYGSEDAEIGDNLNLILSGGDGSNNLYSPSIINPIDGAISEFSYSSSTACAGLSYEGNYKLVFLPFCISAISTETDRVETMRRILEFFDIYQTSETENGISNIKINIYPNPTNNRIISIDAFSLISNIEIYNEEGKKVYSEVPSTTTFSIDLNHLPCGMYFLKVYSNHNVEHRKIVLIN
jgi:CubicO group peptidase (beta-lactamase class C family)